MSPERPRDRLGRPLPAGSIAEGPPVPNVDELTDTEVWELGTSLLAAGLPFHAHEVFESRWRMSTGDERASWRALAQWGAARTHEARGNGIGARRLAERALATLSEAAPPPGPIAWADVRADCRRLAR